ncbi:MAG: molybdopterin biosynthesis protein [Methanotrichaceae archaeon]
MRKEFRSLLSLDEARSQILSYLPVPEERRVPLDSAFGHVLAEKITSEVDVPGFRRASMDGYAVRSEDSFQAREDQPVALKLIGSVPMGAAPNIEVAPGTAAEVSTGSMMPDGADAVVMVEYSEAKDDFILILRPVHRGENVAVAGSDIMVGETVLRPGTRLTAREIGVLAAVGKESVLVRDLLVGVASTGNELVSPGQDLLPGKLYDINSYSIAAAVQECGATPIRYGVLPDDKHSMTAALRRMAETCSMLLISGSTSAGIGDMMYQVLDVVGETIFHGVNLKPGKPTIFGLIDGKPCIGLPGYPTSALTVFELLAAPAIRKALGFKKRENVISGRLALPVRSEGRHQMLAVGVSNDIVYPMDKGSGSITTLALADGTIEIPFGVEYFEKGEPVEVLLFGDAEVPDLTIAGEDCPILEAIIERLPYRTRFISNGSRRGVIAAEDCIADLASISHQNGSDSRDSLIKIEGYERSLGLMSKDSSFFEPEKIREAKIFGWSRDSEMNRLLQKSLAELGLDPKGLEIIGQARAHSAVATAIALGKADIGFGVMAAAESRGLSFKAMAGDRIDFLVAEDGMKKDAVKAFIAYLKADEFRDFLHKP